MIPEQPPTVKLPSPSDVARVSSPTGPSIHAGKRGLRALFGFGRSSLRVASEGVAEPTKANTQQAEPHSANGPAPQV